MKAAELSILVAPWLIAAACAENVAQLADGGAQPDAGVVEDELDAGIVDAGRCEPALTVEPGVDFESRPSFGRVEMDEVFVYLQAPTNVLRRPLEGGGTERGCTGGPCFIGHTHDGNALLFPARGGTEFVWRRDGSRAELSPLPTPAWSSAPGPVLHGNDVARISGGSAYLNQGLDSSATNLGDIRLGPFLGDEGTAWLSCNPDCRMSLQRPGEMTTSFEVPNVPNGPLPIQQLAFEGGLLLYIDGLGQPHQWSASTGPFVTRVDGDYDRCIEVVAGDGVLWLRCLGAGNEILIRVVPDEGGIRLSAVEEAPAIAGLAAAGPYVSYVSLANPDCGASGTVTVQHRAGLRTEVASVSAEACNDPNGNPPYTAVSSTHLAWFADDGAGGRTSGVSRLSVDCLDR